jgi:hypothetical protein
MNLKKYLNDIIEGVVLMFRKLFTGGVTQEELNIVKDTIIDEIVSISSKIDHNTNGLNSLIELVNKQNLLLIEVGNNEIQEALDDIAYAQAKGLTSVNIGGEVIPIGTYVSSQQAEIEKWQALLGNITPN